MIETVLFYWKHLICWKILYPRKLDWFKYDNFEIKSYPFSSTYDSICRILGLRSTLRAALVDSYWIILGVRSTLQPALADSYWTFLGLRSTLRVALVDSYCIFFDLGHALNHNWLTYISRILVLKSSPTLSLVDSYWIILRLRSTLQPALADSYWTFLGLRSTLQPALVDSNRAFPGFQSCNLETYAKK